MPTPVSPVSNYNGQISIPIATVAAPAAGIGGLALIGNGMVGCYLGSENNLGVTGLWRVEGNVIAAAKATGVAWALGDKLYWDDTAKKVTNVATDNTLCGRALAAQVSGATTAAVRLTLAN